MRKIGISAFVIVLIVLICVFSGSILLVSLHIGIGKPGIHPPTDSVNKKWDNIESILSKKDEKTVYEIDRLLSELNKEENNVTSLLEQKASTQIGCISIVITIILAVFSFYIKDLLKFLINKKNLFLYVIFLVSFAFLMATFFCSIFFSYQGFKVSDSFASYDVNSLFDGMEDKGANLTTFQISNIQENYQICLINSNVNDEKADALTWAIRFFILGIICFFINLLFMVCMFYDNSIHQKKEVT